MIISHKYKFIFVKTVKTAGTSIEVFLSQHCAENDILTPVWPHIEPHKARNFRGYWNPLPEVLEDGFRNTKNILKILKSKSRYHNHMSAAAIKLRTNRKIWNTYYKFCLDRNPWDKSLSHFHMLNTRSGGEMSFDEYLKKGDFCLNYPYYCDAKGGLLVDRVIKYEELQSGLGKVFQQLGVPFEGSLGVRAKSDYRKNKTPYQDVYTDEQKNKISEIFAKEIALHGYTF